MTDPIQNLSEGTKHILDALSVAAVVGTIAQILPPIAALFTICWMSMQMFGWIEARREKNRIPKD